MSLQPRPVGQGAASTSRFQFWDRSERHYTSQAGSTDEEDGGRDNNSLKEELKSRIGDSIPQIDPPLPNLFGKSRSRTSTKDHDPKNKAMDNGDRESNLVNNDKRGATDSGDPSNDSGSSGASGGGHGNNSGLDDGGVLDGVLDGKLEDGGILDGVLDGVLDSFDF